jgi:hypothetical protein
MYFVILGRNTKICQKELEYANPQNIKKVSEDILLIEKLNEDKLQALAGVVKR